jgi:hypothetical protein
MLATEYAGYYGIAPQGESEPDGTFRSRVAGALRDQGKVIEAHEAQQDARYEDNDDVMTGIMGAVAQAMQGRNYGRRGESQVGDDIAAGTCVRYPKPEIDPAMALMMIALFG